MSNANEKIIKIDIQKSYTHNRSKPQGSVPSSRTTPPNNSDKKPLSK
jgi:hypothetical protein